MIWQLNITERVQRGRQTEASLDVVLRKRSIFTQRHRDIDDKLQTYAKR